MQKLSSEGFLEKSFKRNFPEFTKKYLCWNLLFDKVKLCSCATSFKSTVSDFSNISSNERRISKQNRKLLKQAVQVKEQVSEAIVSRLQIRCS